MHVEPSGIPETGQFTAGVTLRALLATCALGSLFVVTACQDASSTLGSVAEGAIAEGPCLAQFRSERLEVVTLNGSHTAPGIHIKDASGSMSWGRVSPDGSFVAGTNGTDLVGVSLDGRRVWELRAVFVSGMPAIGRDAKRVAFTSKNQQLKVYDVSTSELRPLTVSGQNPAWSLNGDRLAYDDGAQVHVYELARGTSVDVGRGTEPSWSPDGASLAVRVGSKQVDLVNVQTRERRAFIGASNDISVPRWSPNGEWMMYTREGPRHWWSKAAWTGSEPSQILVRDMKTGAEASIGEFYKANPGDFTWVTNRELCHLRPPTQ